MCNEFCIWAKGISYGCLAVMVDHKLIVLKIGRNIFSIRDAVSQGAGYTMLLNVLTIRTKKKRVNYRFGKPVMQRILLDPP